MLVIGVDEVGRGCLAGPLVVAAVHLYEPVSGLKDSKLLSKAKRTLLSEQIKHKADWGLGWTSPAEVDKLGLTKATTLAAIRAIKQMSLPHDNLPSDKTKKIIIDGNYNYLKNVKGPTFHMVEAVVEADKLVPEVSAASIIAKVARDEYMAEQAAIYSGYGFEAHVGYGTQRHLSAIARHGVCDLHRRSFKPIKEAAVKGPTSHTVEVE